MKPYALTLSKVVWKMLIYKSSMLLGEKIAWQFFPMNGKYTIETYKKSFGSHFKFHSNLLFSISCINDFPSFYQDIFCNWKRYFPTNPETASRILSQYLWFNKFIIVDNSHHNFNNFSSKNINFVSDLVNENCNFNS